MKSRKPAGSYLFDVVNYILLLAFAIVVIVPFIHLINVSLSDNPNLGRGGLVWAPRGFTLSSYRYLLSSRLFVGSIEVSVFITVVGTIVNLILTSLMAYSLSKRQLWGRKTFTVLVLITIFFNPGIIPHYLVVKGVGLIDSIWSLILPTAVSGFNLILMKSFFQNIPEEIEESAKIDGANDLTILWKIVVPLAAPAIATFTLFYSVGHWNTFLQAILYVNDSAKWPIQVILRQLITTENTTLGGGFDSLIVNRDSVQAAAIIMAVLPIMLVYPFLQKHFSKGVMLGSVKG